MSENGSEAFLLSVGSSMEADMIESLLKANDIPVLRKYRETGGYLMIMMGGTIYGVDLYVPGELLEKAREIVESSREASEDEAFPDNIEPEPETEEADVEPEKTKEEPSVSEAPELLAEGLKIDRKRHRNAWIVLLFFIPGFFWMVFILVKYLYELAAK